MSVPGFVSTSQLEIAYEVSGPEDGAVVVAVHGWPDDPHTWDGLAERLHEGGCRVYRPYLRGFGPTRFREAGACRSGQIAALCRDLGEFIEALGLDEVVLAGHDWGGRAAYALAAVRPERVAGLVAMSVPYGATGPTASPSPEQAHAYWYQWYFSTMVGRRALTEDHRAICRYLWRQWSPSWAFTDGEFEQTAAAWDNPDWVQITAHFYSQRWGEDAGDSELAALEARLAASPPIGVPTIVLHGERDGGTLVAATAHQQHFFKSGYERRTLPGVGHFVPREAPDDTATAILELIQRRPRDRGSS
jgi:pimeloyl-ACP methyl ester carboxylesterase